MAAAQAAENHEDETLETLNYQKRIKFFLTTLELKFHQIGNYLTKDMSYDAWCKIKKLVFQQNG